MPKQSPTDTPAHHALERLDDHTSHDEGYPEAEMLADLTTVRDLLLDGDEAAWLSGMFDAMADTNPRLYASRLSQSIHAKVNKIAGFTS